MPAPANLVHQTSTSTGTGNFTLAAVDGKQSFNDAFGTGGTDVFDYFISNRDAAEWERGTGHLSAASTLVRDTVLESTNSDAAVNFSAGTKDVVCDIPADKQAHLDDLASTASSKGASLIGVEDSGGLLSAATVEAALAELANPPSARVTKTGAQSIPNATLTTVTWDSEDWDSASLHDNSTNNSRLTAPVAGKYFVHAFIIFASNNTGGRQVYIYKDGSFLNDILMANNGLGEDHLFIGQVVDLAASGYVEIQVWQGSGGNLNVSASSTFGMTRIAA